METFIIENTWLQRGISDFGWGNGYVIIPTCHKLHSIDYHDIDIPIHGGLTYSAQLNDRRIKGFALPESYLGFWMVGFDTAHSGDTLEKWPKERVQKEAESLLKQLTKLAEKE